MKKAIESTESINTNLEMLFENNDFIEIYKVLNPTNLSQKRSRQTAYEKVIVIFDAFAKKNEKKIRRKIQFENRKEITTVVPLLSIYPKVEGLVIELLKKS